MIKPKKNGCLIETAIFLGENCTKRVLLNESATFVKRALYFCERYFSASGKSRTEK